MKDYYIVEILCYPSYEEKRETYLDNDGNFTYLKNKAKIFNNSNDAFDCIDNKQYIGLIYKLIRIKQNILTKVSKFYVIKDPTYSKDFGNCYLDKNNLICSIKNALKFNLKEEAENWIKNNKVKKLYKIEEIYSNYDEELNHEST